MVEIPYTMDELIELIKERESPDTLLDLLDTDIDTLAEALADEICRNYDKINEAYSGR